MTVGNHQFFTQQFSTYANSNRSLKHEFVLFFFSTHRDDFIKCILLVVCLQKQKTIIIISYNYKLIFSTVHISTGKFEIVVFSRKKQNLRKLYFLIKLGIEIYSMKFLRVISVLSRRHIILNKFRWRMILKM